MTLPVGVGYQLVTVQAPASDLTDFPIYIKIDSSATNFWSSNDSTDKTKARAATQAGVEVPVHVVYFDQTEEVAIYRIKGTLLAAGGNSFRLYPPLAANDSYLRSDTYGSDNVYSVAAYLPLSEDFADASVNADDGVVAAGTPTIIADAEYGGVMSLSGPEYINTPVSLSDQATISCIMNATPLLETGKCVIGSQAGAEVVMRVSGTNFEVILNSFSTNDRVTSSAPLTVDTYHHVALRYNGTNLSVFVDGVESGSVAPTGSWAGQSGFTLGTFNVSGSSDFDGNIGHAVFSDTAQINDWIEIEAAQLLDNSTFVTTSTWTSPSTPDIDSVTGLNVDGTVTVNTVSPYGTVTGLTIGGISATELTPTSATQFTARVPDNVQSGVTVDLVYNGGSAPFSAVVQPPAGTAQVTLTSSDPGSDLEDENPAISVGDNVFYSATATRVDAAGSATFEVSAAGNFILTDAVSGGTYSVLIGFQDASDSYAYTAPVDTFITYTEVLNSRKVTFLASSDLSTWLSSTSGGSTLTLSGDNNNQAEFLSTGSAGGGRSYIYYDVEADDTQWVYFSANIVSVDPAFDTDSFGDANIVAAVVEGISEGTQIYEFTSADDGTRRGILFRPNTGQTAVRIRIGAGAATGSNTEAGTLIISDVTVQRFDEEPAYVDNFYDVSSIPAFPHSIYVDKDARATIVGSAVTEAAPTIRETHEFSRGLADGDSYTIQNRWQDKVIAQLDADGGGKLHYLNNSALGGQKSGDILSLFPAAVDGSEFHIPAELHTPYKFLLLGTVGGNDVLSGGISSATIMSNLDSIINLARAAGITNIVLIEPPPFKGSSGWSIEKQAVHDEVRAALGTVYRGLRVIKTYDLIESENNPGAISSPDWGDAVDLAFEPSNGIKDFVHTNHTPDPSGHGIIAAEAYTALNLGPVSAEVSVSSSNKISFSLGISL